MYQHLSFPDFVLRYFIMIVTQITKHGLCIYTVLDILEELREVKTTWSHGRKCLLLGKNYPINNQRVGQREHLANMREQASCVVPIRKRRIG